MVTPPVTSQKEVTRPWQIRLLQLQTTGSCGFDPKMHSGFLPGGVHPGFLAGGALQGASVQLDLASQNHIGHSGGGSFVQTSP